MPIKSARRESCFKAEGIIQLDSIQRRTSDWQAPGTTLNGIRWRGRSISCEAWRWMTRLEPQKAQVLVIASVGKVAIAPQLWQAISLRASPQPCAERSKFSTENSNSWARFPSVFKGGS